MRTKIAFYHRKRTDTKKIALDFYLSKAIHTRPYGEDIATAIDEEVKNIIDDCYAQAKKIISEHMDVLEKSSELLLEKEKVTREEFEALFDNGSGTDDDGIMGTTIV